MSQDDARLSALLDGALSADEEAALRARLEGDAALRARLAQLADVDVRLRALSVRPVPEDLRARLQARIRDDASPSPAPSAGMRPPRRGSRLVSAAGIAAAAVLGGLVLVVLLPPADPTETPVAEAPAPLPPAAPLSLEEALDAMAYAPDEDLGVIDVLDVLESLGALEGDEPG